MFHILIEFSLHSLVKIELLKSHGIAVSKELVENVVRNPDRIDTGYKEDLLLRINLTIHTFSELFTKHMMIVFIS